LWKKQNSEDKKKIDGIQRVDGRRGKEKYE
jgi:hypothetical protein